MCKQVLVHAAFGIAHLHIAPGHHACSSIHCTLKAVGGHAIRSAPAKGRDEFFGEARAKYIGRYTYYRTGVEHGIDAAFRMVAHHQPAEGKPGFYRAVIMLVP